MDTTPESQPVGPPRELNRAPEPILLTYLPQKTLHNEPVQMPRVLQSWGVAILWSYGSAELA